MRKIFIVALAVMTAVSCSPQGVQLLNDADFERVIGEDSVHLYTLRGGDIVLQLTNFGGRTVALWTPDRNGDMADVELGRSSLEEYLTNPIERFLGANVGPVANRIDDGEFELNGVEYHISKNDNDNSVHGGLVGLDMLVWDVLERNDSSILMTVLHPDGLDGFPGNKTITLQYTLTSDNALKVVFNAVTDAPTPVNLAHHPFFNLSGRADRSVLDYEMTIDADSITEVDDEMIPTGRFCDVEGTAFDFREPRKIGERINDDNEQLKNANGYDHNWVLNRKGQGIQLDATLYDPESGRVLEVWSDQPGLQMYAGNFFNGDIVDKHGCSIGHRCAVVFEPQNFPDAVNNPNFPDSILMPGEVYTNTSIFKFYTK